MKCSGMLGTLALAVTASALAVSDILVAPACAMAEETATPLAVSPLSVEVRADGVDARLTAPSDRVEVGEAIPFVLTVCRSRNRALSANDCRIVRPIHHRGRLAVNAGHRRGQRVYLQVCCTDL